MSLIPPPPGKTIFSLNLLLISFQNSSLRAYLFHDFFTRIQTQDIQTESERLKFIETHIHKHATVIHKCRYALQ